MMKFTNSKCSIPIERFMIFYFPRCKFHTNVIGHWTSGKICQLWLAITIRDKKLFTFHIFSPKLKILDISNLSKHKDTKIIILFARRTGQAYKSVSWEAPKHKDRYFPLLMQGGSYFIGLHASYLLWLVEVVSVALPGVVGVGVPEVGDVVVHGHRVEQHPPRLHLLQPCVSNVWHCLERRA